MFIELVLVSVEQPKLRKPAQNRLETAFRADYIDPHNFVQHALKYARRCLDQFHKHVDKFHSPYTSILQSSGYGKSRLARELAKHVRVVLVCMRPKSLVGVPVRTDSAIRALFDDIVTIDDVPTAIERLGSKLIAVYKNATRLMGRQGEPIGKHLSVSE